MVNAFPQVQNLFPPFGSQPNAALPYVTQASWAVDAAVGNDSNVGTPAAPLRSLPELTRRLSGRIFAASVVNPTVDLIGDFSSQDLVLDPIVVPAQTNVRLRGRMTTVYAGTVNLYSAENPGVALAVLRDLGADFSLWIGKRVRFTSGPASGMTCIILDISGGVQSALVTTCVSESAATANPVAGNTFVIEDWGTKVRTVNVDILGGPTINPPTTMARCSDLFVQSPNPGSSRNNWFLVNGTRTAGYVYGCKLGAVAGASGHQWSRGATFVGCVTDDVSFILTAGEFFEIRCGHLRPLVLTAGYLTGSGSNVSYGGALRNVQVSASNNGMIEDIAPRCIQDSATSTSGAMLIEDGGGYSASTASALLWGTNPLMASAGVFIRSLTGAVYVTKPQLTANNPGVNDVSLGGVLTAYAGIPAINAANLAAMVVRA